MRKTHPPLNPIQVNNKWLYIPIAKNAHRSVVQAIKTNGLEWKERCWNDLPDLPRLVLLREPMDRLKSAYQMFLTDNTIRPDISFEFFVSRLLSGKPIKSVPPDDMHLQTQWAAMGERKPDLAIKWNFSELSKVLGLTVLPHVGRSIPTVGEPLGPQAQKIFEDYYHKDVELWRT